MSGLSWVRNVLIAVVAFAGLATAIRVALPIPEGQGLRLKYEHLSEHRHDYDLIFVGSSRINHSVVPSIVDERLAAHGLDVRSFNFGVNGMQAFEADSVVDLILALQPERLRWLVVEWPDWSGALAGGSTMTERNAHWHSWRRARAAIDSVRRLDPGRRASFRGWRDHVLLLGAHYTNYADGAVALRRLFGLDREEVEGLPEELRQEGFAATGRVQDRPAEAERRRIEKLTRMLAACEALDLGNRFPIDPERYNLPALVAQVERAAAAGVRLVYVLPPGGQAQPQAWRLAAEGIGAPVLLFNSPERYPELYTFENRWDPEHLTEEGANRFSVLLGEALSEVLR